MADSIRTRELLNTIQREEFQSDLLALSNYQMASYYTLNEEDKEIIFRRRKSSNQLGFAVQLCLLRYLGFIPTDLLAIPLDIVDFISEQLNIDSIELLLFQKRTTTLREQRQEIKEKFGFIPFSKEFEKELIAFLEHYAEESRSIVDMLELLLKYLREKKILAPAISYLESIVWIAREKADRQAQYKLIEPLNKEQLILLDSLLNLASNETALTTLGWLKKAPKKASPDSFNEVHRKLNYLKIFDFIPEDLPVAPLKQKEYVALANTYEASSLRELTKRKRYSVLIAFVSYKRKQLIDYAIQIHLLLMATNTKNSKNKLNELFKTKKKSLNSTVDRYIKMGELLLFAKEKNLDPLTLINWENLQIEIDEAKFLKETTSVDYIDFLAKKYGRIRMYSKSLLNSFDFKSVDSAKSLIKGIQHLKSDLDSKKRFLGASTPTDFLSERWKKHVFASDGRINRKFYELALLDTLKV